MDKVSIGYDGNLGLPSDFTEKMSCDAIACNDVTQLVNWFDQKKVNGIFVPVGTLPYIKEYQIIAQASFGHEIQDTMVSNFVTTESIKIQDIPRCHLGRVNQYCTTSYWAPLIYLMNYLPRNSTLSFQNTNGFQDMLNKTAQGVLDGAAVWDIISKQNPAAAAKVHTIFSVTNLPAPVLIAGKDFPVELGEKITQFQSVDAKSFYHGFQKPNLASIEQFLSAIQNAISFYNILI